MQRATSFSLVRDTSVDLIGQVTLTFSDRFRRRIRLTMDGGEPFMLDLAEVTQLSDGGFLAIEGGGQIGVCAAIEEVLEVRTEDPAALVRWAWHLGTRHLPVQFLGADGLRIAWDPVIADMLRGLGAEPSRLEAPFAPEGGAYGGGPTYGHSHTEGHAGGHGQSHEHAHAHSHDHGAAPTVGGGHSHEY
jgi:urease accessory protein